MTRLMMRDIGDGLSVSLEQDYDRYIQLDCGGDKNSFINGSRRIKDDVERAKVFILSHFHNDHYNGLFYLKPTTLIEKLYYPRIPDFEDNTNIKKEFTLYFLVASAMDLGNNSGCMETDLVNLFRLTNKKPFSVHPVAKGDIIDCGNTIYDVLWPPKQIERNSDIFNKVKDAIETLHEAKKEDEDLKNLYDKFESIYEKNYSGEIETVENSRERLDRKVFEKEFGEPNIKPKTKESLKKLRNVANRLSLCFKYNEKLLFLGDLEKEEINTVVQELISTSSTSFETLITPHHGTHWHNSLNALEIFQNLSSLGQGLERNFHTHYKALSYYTRITVNEGDICSCTYLNSCPCCLKRLVLCWP